MTLIRATAGINGALVLPVDHALGSSIRRYAVSALQRKGRYVRAGRPTRLVQRPSSWRRSKLPLLGCIGADVGSHHRRRSLLDVVSQNRTRGVAPSFNICIMVQPPPSVGRNDPVRLAELKRLCVLDSSPERAYDDITRLLATELSVPITMVNLLDEERDWFKSCYGVQQTQSPAVTSFCEIFFTTATDVIVVNDTLLNERLAQHPLVAGRPFIRFYAAARLVVRSQTLVPCAPMTSSLEKPPLMRFCTFNRWPEQWSSF